MFDRFDVDGSGHLERHELMKVGKEQTVYLYDMKHENHPAEKENHRPNLHFFNFLGSTLAVASACITVSEMRGTCF